VFKSISIYMMYWNCRIQKEPDYIDTNTCWIWY